ncbi:MAG: hypothetical protein RMM16_10755 [Chloroherpetonaceae bacterium]|nr:hypothetical protein [Chloroherpetonaceae bacterium]
MKSHVREAFAELERKFGRLNRVGDGRSLFEIPAIDVIVYFRYSKLFRQSDRKTVAFYGLRKTDIDAMLQSGKRAFLYLITDEKEKNLLIPLKQYEADFLATEPSNDGQYKTLAFFKPTGAEIYFANIGKFGAEGYFSLEPLMNSSPNDDSAPPLSHQQVQSLVGAIGIAKGFSVWYPEKDKVEIDFSIVDRSRVAERLPRFGKEIDDIVSEIDVIWLQQNKPVSFWEVEHSTPIYSGLLRFNDVLLTIANADNFNIVAEREREAKFGREINRPTFRQSKLIERVTFVDYATVYNWFRHLAKAAHSGRKA